MGEFESYLIIKANWTLENVLCTCEKKYANGMLHSHTISHIIEIVLQTQ